MSLHKPLPIALFVVAAASAQVQPQQATNDPNNPYGQNNPVPTLLSHGAGVDEGNIGPFATVTDKQFVQLTEYRAMLEIQLGQMALEKASAPEVKALAQRMIDDYTKWQRGLQRAASRLEITVPEDLDKRRKATAARLAALSGSEFDQAYVKEVIRLQNRGLTITQNEATNAGVTGLRSWAGLLLPTLDEHLKLAKMALPAGAARK